MSDIWPPANREGDTRVLSCPAKRENFSCYGAYDVLPDAAGDAPIAVGLLHDYGSWSLFGMMKAARGA